MSDENVESSPQKASEDIEKVKITDDRKTDNHIVYVGPKPFMKFR